MLTHGAGGNCHSSLLIAAAEAFCAEGVSVLRCDLPFRQRRATGPPSPSTAAADREGLRRAVEAMRGLMPGQFLSAGSPMADAKRRCSPRTNPRLAAALLLFSYPLHPPGKPDRLRTEHFPRLRVPAVFVHGTSDPFGSPQELRSAVALIPAHTEIIPIAGAGHDLKRGRFDLGPVVAALMAQPAV